MSDDPVTGVHIPPDTEGFDERLRRSRSFQRCVENRRALELRWQPMRLVSQSADEDKAPTGCGDILLGAACTAYAGLVIAVLALVLIAAGVR